MKIKRQKEKKTEKGREHRRKKNRTAKVKNRTQKKTRVKKIKRPAKVFSSHSLSIKWSAPFTRKPFDFDFREFFVFLEWC